MDDNSTSIEALQAIIDMDDDVPDRWHSIRLPRLKAICRLAIQAQNAKNAMEIAKDANAVAQKTFVAKRKGVDFPCALFPGPAGDCNETNCKCR